MNEEGKEIMFRFIVGDKFVKFAKNEHILSISEAEKVIVNERIENLKFRLGQGISPLRLRKLVELIENRKISSSVIEGQEHVFHKVSKENVHKHREENVLITSPIQIDKEQFRSHLVIDENCAEMSDHVTGQHLQGMLLTESARQMMTAVFEIHILEQKQKQNMYFVLNKLQSTFKNFVFPLPAFLDFQIEQTRIVANGGFVSSAHVNFLQGPRIVCEVHLDFSIFYPSMVSSIERRAVQFLIDESSSSHKKQEQFESHL